MPAPDLALLTEAARAAGEIALSYWKRDPQVWDKGGGHGPVTEADLAVNAMLEDRLRAARPGYGWLSEETADSEARQDCERVFIIDPIDGTRAFIAGEAHFAHALAVAEGGRVVAGVVFLPALGVLYSAAAGGPALRDGQPIRASHRIETRGASVLTTAPNMAAHHWPGGVPELKRSFRASLAWRLCLVAEGRHDTLVSFRDCWEWDIAAGALIAERAGAVVSDGRGEALRFNRPVPQSDGLMVGPPGLHGDLLARRLGTGAAT